MNSREKGKRGERLRVPPKEERMTKELLEQYPDLCAEIKDLERRMQNPVTDTVSGSSSGYPYTQHPVSIRGVPPGLQEQRDRLVEQKTAIEAFVASLPTSKQRRIVTYRALGGLAWAQVAARMGHRYSESGAKSVYQRILKEIS